MNPLIASLNCNNQTEFEEKCKQLNQLLHDKQNHIAVNYNEDDKSYHVSAMPKLTGLYWLISKIYKRQECRFDHISHEVVRFLETNLNDKKFTYRGDLVVRLQERWSHKPIAQRLNAIYKAHYPDFEAYQIEITKWNHEIIDLQNQALQHETNARTNAVQIEEQAKMNAFNIETTARNKAIAIEEEANDYFRKTEKKCQQLLRNASQAVQTALNSQKLQEPEWKNLRHEDADKDLIIHCSDGLIKAHSLIINSKKSFFQTKSQSSMGEGLENEVAINSIDLKDFPKDLVELLFDFLYTKNVSSISIAKVLALYELADYLLFDELKKHCINLCYQIFKVDIRLSYYALMENWDRLISYHTLESHLIWNVGQAVIQNLLSAEEAKNLFVETSRLHEDNKENIVYKSLLGIALLKGIGTEKNEGLALEYFEACAGYDVAQFGLGYIYQHGLANQLVDLDLAEKLYRKARDRNYSPALNALAMIANATRGIILAMIRDMGYAETQWNEYLYGGNGDSLEYLRKAAAQGLECAVKRLKEIEATQDNNQEEKTGG